MQIESQPRYKKHKILPPFDEDFKNIPESMKSLYTQKLVMVNTESESDNISPDALNEIQANHLDQKLSLKKEDCDKMFVGINNFKNLEGWLEDTNRIDPYREAILYNRYRFENKVIYDINSPYGIFGMFALQSKAKFVIVTCSKNFSSFVNQIYKDNGFTDDQFLVIEDTLNRTDSSILTKEQSEVLERIKANREIDIILGEWNGSILVNTKTIRDVIEVRDKFLHPSGSVFPNKGHLVMNFIEDSKYYEERFGFWNDVYGFNMKNVKELVYNEACLDYCTNNMIQTFDNIFHTIDLNKDSIEDLNLVQNFRCKAKESNYVHAAVLNFRIVFENCHFEKHYSNSSFGKKINFSQCILYLKKPFKVTKSGIIDGKIAILGDLKNHEKLKIKLLVKYGKKNEQIQYYHVD